MKRKRITIPLSVLLLLILFLASPARGYVIDFFTKNVAGLGQMTYTDEVTVVDIKVKSLSKVVIELESNDATVVDRVYQVYLYLDDVKVEPAQEVSWAGGEIPGVKKKVEFTGLDLLLVDVVDAEVVY